jgi:hypothetical protein
MKNEGIAVLDGLSIPGSYDDRSLLVETHMVPKVSLRMSGPPMARDASDAKATTVEKRIQGGGDDGREEQNTDNSHISRYHIAESFSAAKVSHSTSIGRYKFSPSSSFLLRVLLGCFHL